MKKVVLGLSGGVDSAVAAELLKEEYELLGLYLDTGTPGGAEAARKAADYAGIPLTVEDARQALEDFVCAPFAAAYRRGETPNPCVLCNPAVKLAALERYAVSAGADYIATGHYALRGADGIYRGRPANDQSYMLCRITPSQARKLLLPLGPYEKSEVRALAQARSLPSGHSPDSMEICFIPDNDYAAWLEARGEVPPAGDFLYQGKVLGRHGGIHRCTVGQHRNLGVSAGHKVYVGRIEADKALVHLVDAPELMKTKIRIRDCSWLDESVPGEFSAAVRIRHSRLEPTPCTVKLSPEGGAQILCQSPVRAPAPGQSAVLYAENGRLLGGGFISDSE